MCPARVPMTSPRHILTDNGIGTFLERSSSVCPGVYDVERSRKVLEKKLKRFARLKWKAPETTKQAASIQRQPIIMASQDVTSVLPVKQQTEFGSWHVKSRSKPFQKYFETGFPHAQDQFISTTATAWSTIALLLALPTQHENKRQGN